MKEKDLRKKGGSKDSIRSNDEIIAEKERMVNSQAGKKYDNIISSRRKRLTKVPVPIKDENVNAEDVSQHEESERRNNNENIEKKSSDETNPPHNDKTQPAEVPLKDESKLERERKDRAEEKKIDNRSDESSTRKEDTREQVRENSVGNNRERLEENSSPNNPTSRNNVNDLKGTQSKSPTSEKSNGTDQTKMGAMGDSIKNKLAGSVSDKVPGGAQAQKAAKAVKNVQKIAKGTSTFAQAAITILSNPITWIGIGILLFAGVLFSGSQLLGKSDFAKNCDTSGDLSVSVDMPADEKGRADIVATWLTSNKFSFMGGKPMTKEQAAGIIGNFKQESQISPTLVQTVSLRNPDYYKTCNNECVLGWGTVGGKAIGLMQWDGGRRVNLVKHAQSKGKQWYDVNIQLDFLRIEADGAEKASFTKNFANCKTAEQCAIDFCKDVERAGVPNMKTRTDYAASFLKVFTPGASVSGSSSGSVSSCSADSASVDMSDTVKLAISMAYPTAEYSKSRVSGSDSYGKTNAKAEYKAAKAEAEKNGGADPMPGLYASCDRFVATILKATKADTGVPWGATDTQYNYFKSSSKWKEVKCEDRKPGDVIITRANGHIMLYLGQVKGQDSLASASYLDRVGAVGPFGGCSGGNWLADGWPMNGNSTTGFRLVK